MIKIIKDKIKELEDVNKKYFLNDNEQLNNQINILLIILKEGGYED